MNDVSFTPQPPNQCPGDLVFCHSVDIVGRFIRLAERIRFRGGSMYNHVATLNEWHTEDGGFWTVIQAEAHGITDYRELDDVAPGGSYTIVPTPAQNVAQQLAFLRAQVGEPYGFLTIASILVNLMLPKFIDVELPGTWICSAVAAEALRAGGWLHNWPDIYEVSPAQLFEILQ